MSINADLEDLIYNSSNSEDVIVVKHELEQCGFNKEFIKTCVQGIKTREWLETINEKIK